MMYVLDITPVYLVILLVHIWFIEQHVYGRKKYCVLWKFRWQSVTGPWDCSCQAHMHKLSLWFLFKHFIGAILKRNCDECRLLTCQLCHQSECMCRQLLCICKSITEVCLEYSIYIYGVRVWNTSVELKEDNVNWQKYEFL